jgi:Flp pilus assembly protein TadG
MHPMKAVSHTGLICSLSRLTRDVRAVSAVEFAMILPIMVTLFLGGTELSQAIAVKRKSVLVNRTIADLVAQDSCISNAEMTGIFNASAAVIQPYTAGNLKIVVSGVSVDVNGIAKVVWSDPYQATARVVGSTLTLPTGLNTAGSWLVFAETTYEYTPPIGYTIVGMLPLKDTMYLRPRLTASISRVGC